MYTYDDESEFQTIETIAAPGPIVLSRRPSPYFHNTVHSPVSLNTSPSCDVDEIARCATTFQLNLHRQHNLSIDEYTFNSTRHLAWQACAAPCQSSTTLSNFVPVASVNYPYHHYSHTPYYHPYNLPTQTNIYAPSGSMVTFQKKS